MKSNKMPYMIYADLQSLTKKIEKCAKNTQ